MTPRARGTVSPSATAAPQQASGIRVLTHWSHRRAVLEKIEGLAVLPGGDALIVNDNDGVDDSNGETQLLRLPAVFD